MTPPEAAKLLEVPADATPEQLEARFLELRRQLEDKIAKSPTPGLQAKYRENLATITTAFETLALAADGSALPVLNKQSVVSGQPSAPVGGGVPPPREAPAKPAAKKSGSGKEFIIVAVIAVVVLGAGGWFVMKTRAEKAEQTRVAAEEARLAAEAKTAADLKAAAEQERVTKLNAELRSQLAEYKVEWEAIEREERLADRQLSELKSDVRSLRDAPAGKVAEMQARLQAQQDFAEWMSATLARHPARLARGRAEELLSAKQYDPAQAAVHELKSALNQLKQEIATERATRLAVEGTLSIRTDTAAEWTLTDAFDRVHTGRGPAQVDHVAFGPARIEFTMREWPVQVETPLVSRSQPNVVVLDYNSPRLLAIRDALRAKAKAEADQAKALAKQAEQDRQAEAARVAEENRRQAERAEIARREAQERAQAEQLRQLEARRTGGY